MKSKILLFSLFALPFFGVSQQTLTLNLTHDGLQRSYILYVPANYTGNTAVPLVFNFHGYGSNATEQMWYGDFRAIANAEGFIIAHPEGTVFNGSTHFNVGGFTLGSTVDDVGFTAAMIDTISTNYNIDPARIYSTGMSNGGYMSLLLACQLSDKIAAVASVTGSMTPQMYDACSPQHKMPVLQIHGTMDGTVPYTGNPLWTKSISDVMQYWANFNNCGASPSVTAVPNTNTTDSSTVEHMVYGGCDNSVSVEHFKITNGDHTWAGSVFAFPGTNYDINASVEVWDFFARYDINGLVSGVSAISEESSLEVFPNPTAGSFNVKLNFTNEMDFVIYSSIGEVMQTGVIRSDNHEINVSQLSPNIYFLKIGGSVTKIMKQ